MPPKFRALKKEVSLTSKPPSHVHEYDPRHRKFLRRSLDRSDKELAALQTLHDTLYNARSLIVERYGMDVLLDVGEGVVALNGECKLNNADKDISGNVRSISSGSGKGGDKGGGKLIYSAHTSAIDYLSSHSIDIDNTTNVDTTNDDTTNVDTNTNDTTTNDTNTTTNDTTTTTNDDNTFIFEFESILSDFLLRMELRRKILNRLSRRILRLSHAMDGKHGDFTSKVTPPPNPKYGDVRYMRTHEEYGDEFKLFSDGETLRNEALERVKGRLRLKLAAKVKKDVDVAMAMEVKEKAKAAELEAEKEMEMKAKAEELKKTKEEQEPKEEEEAKTDTDADEKMAEAEAAKVNSDADAEVSKTNTDTDTDTNTDIKGKAKVETDMDTQPDDSKPVNDDDKEKANDKDNENDKANNKDNANDKDKKNRAIKRGEGWWK